MQRYKTRPGVIATQICDEYLLVAAKAARDAGCPFVTFLNDSSAFIWSRLEDGADLAELEKAVSEEFEVEDPQQTRALIGNLLKELAENHYLLPI